MKSDTNNYLSLLHFFSKSLFLGIGISKIIMIARESTIISIILGSIIGYFILSIINNLNYTNANKFQKICMFIILYILFTIGIIEIINLISSIYLMDTNKYILMIPLLIVILYMNTKSITINMKISNILLYIVDISIIIAFLALIPKIKLTNYLPLFNTKLKDILLASIEYALYSVTPNILYGGIKYNYKNKNKDIKKRYIYSNIFLIIIILTTQGVLSTYLVDLFKYPEYIVLKKINLLDFINNVENIFSFIWIYITYIYLSICSKQMYDMVSETFNNKYIYPIFLFISMYFITKYLLNSQIFLLNLFNCLWIICLIILILYILINITSYKKE